MEVLGYFCASRCLKPTLTPSRLICTRGNGREPDGARPVRPERERATAGQDNREALPLEDKTGATRRTGPFSLHQRGPVSAAGLSAATCSEVLLLHTVALKLFSKN